MFMNPDLVSSLLKSYTPHYYQCGFSLPIQIWKGNFESIRGGTTTRVLGPRASWSRAPTEGQLSIHEHLYNPGLVSRGVLAQNPLQNNCCQFMNIYIVPLSIQT